MGGGAAAAAAAHPASVCERVCPGVCAAESERAGGRAGERARAPPSPPGAVRPSPRAPSARRASRGGSGSPPRSWGSRAPGPRRARRRDRRAAGRVGVRAGAPGKRLGSRTRGRERGRRRAWKGVCARWTGCASAGARPAGRCVSEVRGECRLGDNNFLAASRTGLAPGAFPGAALAPRPAPRPALQRRVWSRDRGRSGALDQSVLRSSAPPVEVPLGPGPGPQFPGACGETAGQSGVPSPPPARGAPGTPPRAAAGRSQLLSVLGSAQGSRAAGAQPGGGRGGDREAAAGGDEARCGAGFSPRAGAEALGLL